MAAEWIDSKPVPQEGILSKGNRGEYLGLVANITASHVLMMKLTEDEDSISKEKLLEIKEHLSHSIKFIDQIIDKGI